LLPDEFSLLSGTFRTILEGLGLTLGDIEEAALTVFGVDWLLVFGVDARFGVALPRGVVAPRGVRGPRGLILPLGVEAEGDLEVLDMRLGGVFLANFGV